MNVIRKLALAGLALCWAGAVAAAEVDLDRYLKPDSHGEVKISPTGEYYAITIQLPDRAVLVIQRRSDNKVMAKVGGSKNSAVADFWWVNDHRVMVAMAEKSGSLDKPTLTGNLHGMNVDGSGGRLLIGTLPNDDRSAGSDIDLFGREYQYAEMIDTLPKEDDFVLVGISTWTSDPITRVARMNVNNGRLTDVANAPLNRASFVTDGQGQVRFAMGLDKENFSKLLYRDNDKAPWQTINDERTSNHVESPLGFSADGKTAYLEADQASGPDAIVAFDPATGKKQQVLRDGVVDPDLVLYARDGSTPIGASFVSARRSNRYFDEESDEAVLYRTLDKAFEGNSVLVTSGTADGKLVLVQVWSDTNPGDFYLFDTQAKTANGVFSRRVWLDPEKMSPVRSVELKARDGLALHGYLTLPRGGDKNLPMVVLPHGGPFGIADSWDFDTESQMLAEAGYAVLRVNYRGSGNNGRSFQMAGARQWGKLMQDDVTDATKWAIAQGFADPKRICIYGASYGAYAAMMGLAREPELYKCGVGYVGVYDLQKMVRDDSRHVTWLKNWSQDWVGPLDTLEAVSPTSIAARIKQPVFLAAGGEDYRAPLEHSK
jgi:dipeptidyl aminopeptidase/acylaminoacyl peptidase